MSDQSYSERLVDFLYVLGRDHLALGALEDIMWEQVDTERSSYCNTYLEEYARDLATRLTNDSVPYVDWKHMYRDDQKRYRIGRNDVRVEDPRKLIDLKEPDGPARDE